MFCYRKAAVERAMKVQEVILRAMGGWPTLPRFNRVRGCPVQALLGRGFSSVTAIAFHFGNPPINQALFSLTPHPVLTNLDLYPKENKCRQHITSIVSIFCPHPLWNERSRS